MRPRIKLLVGTGTKGKVLDGDHFDLEVQYDDGLKCLMPNCSVEILESDLVYKGRLFGGFPHICPETEYRLKLKQNGEQVKDRSRVIEHVTRPFTRRYFTIEEAIRESEREDPLIPSEFLNTFPNNFGINLCSVKGFEVIMSDDNQYKSIRVDFLPVEHPVGIDDRES